MATVTGSGKWIKAVSGVLSFGVNSTTYGSVYAASVTQNSATYLGIYAATMSFLSLTNVSEITIGDAEGYTGVIKMYTSFTDPYNVVIWDPELNDISRVTTAAKTYRFVRGFMVGEA